jgi:uroporphyrinogen decarboxylase
MTSFEKYNIIKEVMNQEITEKVPYAVWKHFVEADRTPENLAEAQLTFQTKFDSVFMKISPHGSYCVVDFGGVLGGYRPISGSRICERPPILSLDDWETLEPVDPHDGEFGQQIKAVELITRKTENEVPTVMTVFSPFMVASKLDPSLLEHLAQDRKLLSEQLKMLTDIKKEFSLAVLDAGADGIFLATQHFNESLNPQNLEELEFSLMKTILEATKHKIFFNILHLHGENPFYRKGTELPVVHALNWHDQTTNPSLNEARQDFTGALLGGIDEMGALRTALKSEVEQNLSQIYRQFDGRGLIFAPGCVLPQNFSDEQIELIISTINTLQPV